MNFDMTFKDWCLLWKRLFLTVWGIIFGLAIILTRGTIKFVLRAYKCLLCWIGTHPKGALSAFLMCLVLTWMLASVAGGVRQQQTSLMVDSISHVCDSLRNGDRYEAGYADGIKAMRNRKLDQYETLR